MLINHLYANTLQLYHFFRATGRKACYMGHPSDDKLARLMIDEKENGVFKNQGSDKIKSAVFLVEYI